MKRFENKIALVTGAAFGIGRATALSFAREGAKLVLADINPVLGQQVLDEIKALGNEGIFVTCNIGKREEVLNLINLAIQTFGRIDVAANCAGIAGAVSKPVHEYPEEDWINQIQINLIGTWYCVKFQIEQMLTQRGGNIVCVS